MFDPFDEDLGEPIQVVVQVQPSFLNVSTSSMNLGGMGEVDLM